jgi:hypothetical protein
MTYKDIVKMNIHCLCSNIQRFQDMSFLSLSEANLQLIVNIT